MTLRIDADRVAADLETLAGFSESEPPGITRIVFSPPDLEARSWLKHQFTTAGLSVREDAVGNTFARWAGSDQSLPAVATGSHIDAIPCSGKFDGTVGVLGALEAIRTLQRAGLVLRRSIELVLFTSEEPTRFGIGCLGSRLLSGALTTENAASLKDREGNALDQVRRAAGFEGNLPSVPLARASYSSFLELHIEQGPILERRHTSIGIVTQIAAPAALSIEVQGEGGHAGAVLMPERKDAFLAAAEIALSVEQAASTTGAIDTVATTGVCEVFPGAVNSIPSRVLLQVDVRDTDGPRRDAVLRQIEESCRAVSVRRKLVVKTSVLNADDPVHCDLNIIETLVRACEISGHSYRQMVSRAYHDSLFMARLAPTAMLFIPCRNGWSHRPDEYASPEQIAAGIEVVAHALAELAQ